MDASIATIGAGVANRLRSRAARLGRALPLLLACGCAALVGSAVGGLADGVSSAILNQDDLETVRDGAPAYLLLVDGLIERDPGNAELLLAGASLYGAYASAFVDEPERARRMAERSRSYGQGALCRCCRDLCAAVDRPYREFEPLLRSVRRRDVPALYGFATAWAGWVQVNSDDWGAVAEVPKIEAALERVVQLDETYQGGSAHLYLGVLATLLPESMGGQTEQGRRHFERGIELSRGRDLMAKVLYARHYARLVFDRELHDRLLREVLAADPVAPRLTLSNTLAQEEARRLLESADDYF